MSVTASPTSSTMPAPSWPIAAGARPRDRAVEHREVGVAQPRRDHAHRDLVRPRGAHVERVGELGLALPHIDDSPHGLPSPSSDYAMVTRPRSTSTAPSWFTTRNGTTSRPRVGAHAHAEPHLGGQAVAVVARRREAAVDRPHTRAGSPSHTASITARAANPSVFWPARIGPLNPACSATVGSMWIAFASLPAWR